MTAAIRKLISLETLLNRLARHRRRGERIVFTNGCFDILHVGHVRYLRAARQLGDVLVVGLNTDDSVRRLKGKNRPVNTLADRAEILAALPFVTWLVAFETDSVEPLIKAVRPDVLVKGGDYKPSQVVGHKYVRSYGGQVIVLEHAHGRSTSRTLRRLGRV